MELESGHQAHNDRKSDVTISRKSQFGRRKVEPMNTAPDSAAAPAGSLQTQSIREQQKRRSSWVDLLPLRVDILESNPGRPQNVITTAQYNAFNFLPLVLYEKFHPAKCFSNFFFLCIGALQIVPAITITNGMPNQWLPLILIVSLDIMFLYWEDKARHKADKAANAQEVDILQTPPDAPAAVNRLTWADVKVGDVVRPPDPPCWVSPSP